MPLSPKQPAGVTLCARWRPWTPRTRWWPAGGRAPKPQAAGGCDPMCALEALDAAYALVASRWACPGPYLAGRACLGTYLVGEHVLNPK